MNSRYDFVGHNSFEFGDSKPQDVGPINNVIVRTEDPDLKWIEATTEKIGEWRAVFRSTYISWSLTINGLHIANQKYSSQDWIKNNAFKISSVRPVNGRAGISPIALWESEKVADAHLKPLAMICSYGLIDLYSCLEEFVFDFYKIYWWNNPELLMRGPEYRELREKHRNIKDDESAWESAFSERVENWQRKKLYNGLGKVFRSYCDHAKLSKPSWYDQTDIDTWAESIEGFSLLRNCLTHGVENSPKELAEFSTKPHRMGFDFKEGEKIVVSLHHLMHVEFFCDSLLSGINASLFERAKGNIADAKSKFEKA